MLNIYLYTYLLLALTMVEMKVLKITGHVGENLKFECSNWKVWTNVQNNVKYLCKDPCNEDKHIIIKAAFKKTQRKDRIQITNLADHLSVTFMNLKLSDSRKYVCGVERYGWDSFIKVDLQVINGPKPSAKTTTVGSKVSSAVTTTSTMSSRVDITTKSSVSYSTLHTTTTATAGKGTGSVPYLIVGFTMTIISLIVLLLLMRTVKRQNKVVGSFPPDSPPENAHVDIYYEEIRIEDRQTESQSEGLTPAHSSTANATSDSECLYGNHWFLQHTKLDAEWNNYSEKDSCLASIYEVDPKAACAESLVTDPSDDMVYSLAQLPKEKTEDSGQSDSTQPKSNEEDF